MSITNFSELRTAIENWMARSDLTSYTTDFVTLGELRLNRELRVRGLESALSDTIASGVISVPSDYLEMKSLYIDTTPTQQLERTSVEKLYAKYPRSSTSGLPVYFAREGSNIIFGNYPDSNYSVKGIYYAKPTALSASNTTNWYISNVPDLFLYAALIEACIFTEDDTKKAKYENLYNRSMMSLMREEQIESLSGSQLRSIPG